MLVDEPELALLPALLMLLAPPIQMRHVDLAQVVQIARRRRLDLVSALPAAIEGGLRLPLVEASAEEKAVVRQALERHNLLATV